MARIRGEALAGGAALLLLTAAALSLAPVAGATARRSNVAPSSTGRTRPLQADGHGNLFVADELVVRFKPEVSAARRADIRRELGTPIKRPIPIPGAELLTVEAGEVPGAVAALSRRPDVRYAEPNYASPLSSTPNDPRFGDQWGLHNVGQTVTTPGGSSATGTPDADIDAPEAWDISQGSDQVTVAIVDTGVAYDHPDLAPQIWNNPGETGLDGAGHDKRSNGVDDDGNGYRDDWRGYDFFDSDNDPWDVDGHGTNVASIVGARGNDAYGVTGVNWHVKLMPLRAGDVLSYDDAVAAAFAYAGRMGVKVVQASVGTTNSSLVSDTIAGAPNTLFVVAAGNEGQNLETSPDFPCSFNAPNLVCVAATDLSDNLTSFSNYGEQTVDLAAPGDFALGAAPAYQTLFSDDFETDIAGRWVTGGTNNTWARTTSASSGGSYSLTDSPAGNYLNNTNSWARTANRVNLTGKQGCRLDYELRLDVQPPPAPGRYYDALFVEGSTNGSSWSVVDAEVYSEPQFFPVTIDLSRYDGQQVYLRFRLESDGSVARDGAYVDDVSVRCRDTYSGDEFSFYRGTSQAAPHVAGVAALVLATQPGASMEYLRDQLLRTVDIKSSLVGKTVTGGRVNAHNALADTGHPRPRGATPVRVALVPSYVPCMAPNRSHGAPLSYGSCSPPTQNSPYLTVGTPDANGASANSIGSLELDVKPGQPGPPDDSDVLAKLSITDVRCRSGSGVSTCGSSNTAGGPDYTGQVFVQLALRLTDRFNAPSGSSSFSESATTQDFYFFVTGSCQQTSDVSVGATCSANTSFNALEGGTVLDSKRAIEQVSQVVVGDGGSDGTASTAPNYAFATQGLFVP
jgi:thermitase